MKKNKKLLLVLLLLIVVSFSISAISASDVDNHLSDNQDSNILSDDSSVNNVLTDENITENTTDNTTENATENITNITTRDNVYVSVNGSDTDGDGSQENPYATIQKGVYSTSENGTLYVSNGTYLINSSIIIDRIMTIQGSGNSIIDGGGKVRLLNLTNTSGLTMNNMILTRGYGEPYGGVALVNGIHHPTAFNNCTFSNNYATFGGGVFGGKEAFNYDNYRGILRATSCVFVNNKAGLLGGVYYIEWGTYVLNMKYCVLFNNTGLPYIALYVTFPNTSDDIDYNYWGFSDPFDLLMINQDVSERIGHSVWLVPHLVLNTTELNGKNSSCTVSIKFTDQNGTELNESAYIPKVDLKLFSSYGYFIPNETSVTNNEVASIFKPIDNGNATLHAHIGNEVINATVLISGLPERTTLNISSGNMGVYYGRNNELTYKLVNSTGGPVKDAVIVSTINGKNYTGVTDENGMVSFDLNLPVGVYDVVTNFYGNESFKPTSLNSTIKILSSINPVNNSKYYNNTIQYSVQFLDRNGNPLENSTVSLVLNGVVYSVNTDSEGIANFEVNSKLGNNIAVLVNYNTGEVKLANLTVLSTINGNNVVKIYNNSTPFTAQFLDDNGNPLANTSVNITLNGKNYTVYTNEEGFANLSINLKPGKYSISTINPVSDEVKIYNVTVLSPITENNNVIKYYKNSTNYKVRILDLNGKPLSGAKVQFKINGKTYTNTTNSNGYAVLGILLSPNKYTVTASYGGCYVTNTITVLTLIKNNKNMNMYYRNGSKFTVLILNSKGLPKAGANVGFIINGKTYKVVTNSKGYASLPINLAPKKYTITTIYAGLKVSNTINVLPRLTAKNVKIRSGSYFSAKLVDKHGKPMSHVKIRFTIRGRTYAIATNSKGIASMRITLKKGTYTITTVYGSLKITNKIRVY